jgi:hypothetical protein
MDKKLVVFIIFLVLTYIYLNRKSSMTNIPNVDYDYVYKYYLKYANRFSVNNNKGKLNGVDMVYCITMPQRRQYAENQINKLGVQCTFLNAITPLLLSTDDYDHLSIINVPDNKISNRLTRLPVLLSFIFCFMDAKTKGYEEIVVFEDDFTIDVDLKTLNAALDEFKKSKFDIFYMGYCFMQCNSGIPTPEYKYLVDIFNKMIVCCHAIALKTDMVKDLVNYCFPMVNNSDEMFRDYFIEYDRMVCVPKVAYFGQNRDDLGSHNESYGTRLDTCIYQ